MIDVFDAADDFKTFDEWNHGHGALRPRTHLIRDHPGDEIIAIVSCISQDVEVPYMKQIEDTGRVADTHSHGTSSMDTDMHLVAPGAIIGDAVRVR